MSNTKTKCASRFHLIHTIGNLPGRDMEVSMRIRWMIELAKHDHVALIAGIRQHPELRDLIRTKAPNEFNSVMAEALENLTGMRWKPVDSDDQVSAILRPRTAVASIPERAFACRNASRGCTYRSGERGITTHQRSCTAGLEAPSASGSAELRAASSEVNAS